MIKTITSTAQGSRWVETLSQVQASSKHQCHIEIDTAKQKQTHLGFGGAITEATAYTILEGRSEDEINTMIDLYFGPKGLNYNLTRIHMNSSDFSLGNYTYVKDFDTTLKTFDITRETLYTIPLLKRVLKRVPDLKILISPWSPPWWMKDNKLMNHGGKLLPEFRQLWADYFVKFIDELKKHDIHPWAVSVQNEPAAKQVWDSCLYTAEEERDFVKDFLGPTLKKHYPNVHIIVWDHNRDIIVERLAPIYEDPKASSYVWGGGFHWYGEEAFSNLTKIHQMDPSKHLLFTEGCIEGGPRPGSWDTGVRYARNIIEDFNNYNEGFIDWNLVLNEQGGPNHVGNYCDAPVLYHRQKRETILNSTYYVLGHFSKFIPVGSTQLHLEKSLNKDVYITAYLTPTKQIILTTLNHSSTNCLLSYRIEEETFAIELEANSVQTFILNEKSFR
jgi:glucosylceramidase